LEIPLRLPIERMPAAVDLDDEPGRGAVEIDDGWPDRLLPSEAESQETSRPKLSP